MYCFGFIATISAEAILTTEMKEEGVDFFEDYGALITTATIQVASVIWRKIAPKLAEMQNPRTEARWNDAMTKILSTVLMFIALYPFCKIAFITKWTDPTCGSEFGEGSIA